MTSPGLRGGIGNLSDPWLIGHLGSLRVEIGAHRLFSLGGALTGPVFGALGAWFGRRHRRYA